MFKSQTTEEKSVLEYILTNVLAIYAFQSKEFSQ